MSVRWKMDASEVKKEWKRLKKERFKAAVACDAVLEEAFILSQAATHILTGSLKNSGKSSSSFSGETWKGEIAYGGASVGAPKDPVVYAWYEWRRGGAHNFFVEVWNPVFEEKFSDAIIHHYFKG